MCAARDQRAAARCADGAGQVARELGIEIEPGTGARVDEAEVGRVQRQARDRDRILAAAIDGVAKHRVAERREVDPHLVRAARPQLRLDERHGPEPLERPNRRPGGLARTGGERCAPGAGARPTYAAFDEDLALDVAGEEGAVAAAHRVRAELPLQVLGGRVAAGEHHDARGIAVETVHDADLARVAEAARELDHEAGEDGVLLAVGGRVDQHAGGLVHHHQVVVDVQDFDPGAARHGRAPRQARTMRDLRIRAQDVARVGHHGAVDRGVADQHLALGVAVGRAEDRLQAAGQAQVAGRWLHHGNIAPPAAAGDDRLPR